MFRGDKPGINLETATPNGEVVKSALELHASHLHDAKASPLCAIVDRQLFKQYDTMGDRVQLQIVLL
jgi:hypothetical protein